MDFRNAISKLLSNSCAFISIFTGRFRTNNYILFSLYQFSIIDYQHWWRYIWVHWCHLLCHLSTCVHGEMQVENLDPFDLALDKWKRNYKKELHWEHSRALIGLFQIWKINEVSKVEGQFKTINFKFNPQTSRISINDESGN